MPEPSNRKPLIILAVVVVILFIVLFLAWQFWDGKSVNDQTTTTASFKPHVLTEEEKNQIRLTMQFAPASQPLDLNTSEGKKTEAAILKTLESVSAPSLGVKEQEAILRTLNNY